MSTDPSGARQLLEDLRQGFILHVPQRLAAIEQCWIDCYMDADPATALHELSRLAHSLRGSAKTFGLMELGEAAGQLENEISPWAARGQAPDPKARAQLDERVAALRTCSREVVVAHAETVSVPVQANTGHAPRVYVLEDDPAQASLLSSQLEHFGYQVTTFETSNALLKKLKHARPDICILDIILLGHGRAGIDLAMELHRHHESLPLVFISVRDDIQARLGAVKAGGIAYLTKPVDFSRLIEVVDQAVGLNEKTPYRILVVDDDQSLARYYQALLQDSGMKAKMVTDPLKVLDAVEDFRPDLVLMDIYMPQCTGAELAQVIRQHGSHGALPIVFLSTEWDTDIQYAALRAGGDDFLTKPVDPRVLIRTVTIRAQRARLLGELMVRDSLTGLLNHSRIKEMLIAEVARARRANTVVSVAMLDLDHFKSVNDQYGHMTGDRVIKSLARLLHERLRDGDWAGRYGGEEFLLVLPNCDRESALRLVDDMRSRFARIAYSGETRNHVFHATFSAGLESFPPATSADELLLQADAQLYKAKQAGRNCIR